MRFRALEGPKREWLACAALRVAACGEATDPDTDLEPGRIVAMTVELSSSVGPSRLP
jgi:hypothetical protein